MLSELFGRRVMRDKPEERGGVEVILEAWRANRAAAGGYVSPGTAIQNSAVWAAVLLLSDTLASLPLIIYERQQRAKQRAPQHYLYPLLHDAVNEQMTAFDFREFMQASLLLWGNAYAQIFYDGRGRITEMWPLLPGRMQDVRVVNKKKYFKYQNETGKIIDLTDDDVWHIPGFGGNGIVGYSTIALFRRTIGLANAAEEFGSRFFENDARPGVVLEHPAKLGDQAYRNLRDSWAETHQGVENSHKPAILEEGMKLHEIGIPPEDAQFLETRKFQVTEIARIFRVPPHLIADLDQATFSNIEQQSLEYVIHSVRPWLTRWEQSIHLHLMLTSERQRYFAEFLVDGLLRGDIVSRYNAYAVGRQNGWLSANDIRELENMNPVEGGDVYLVPLNMIPADQVGGKEPSTEPTSGLRNQDVSTETRGDWASLSVEQRELRGKRSATARHRIMLAQQKVILDVAERATRRETHDVGEAIKKYFGKRDAAQFLVWMEEFYEEHANFIQRQYLPVFLAYAELIAAEIMDELGDKSDDEQREVLERFVRAYLRTFAVQETGRSLYRLKEVIAEANREGTPVDEALQVEVDHWKAARPAEIASEQSTRAGNAIAKTLYAVAGVQILRWNTFGDSCPYCKSLDGRTTDIKTFFLAAGDEINGGEGKEPMKVSKNIGHPPAHGGCDCMISAG